MLMLKTTPMQNNYKDYEMPFGKYEGMTLDEIYAEDPDYLEWIKDTFEDGKVKIRVTKYLRTP